MTADQHLINNYHFCPQCKTSLVNDDSCLFCPNCHLKIYHNPALAVAVIAFNQQGEVLLNKRKISPHRDYWDTVGGFVNVGETVEQAVVREFLEETQAHCKIVRYWGSAPDIYGPEQSATINLFFEVKIVSGQLQASDDAAELAFFALDRLPEKIAFANTKIFLNLLKMKKEKNDK